VGYIAIEYYTQATYPFYRKIAMVPHLYPIKYSTGGYYGFALE
jgi:hypothetical protein